MSDTTKQPCDHGAVTDHHNGSITCDWCNAEVVWSHQRFAWITGKAEPGNSTRPAMTTEVAKMASDAFADSRTRISNLPPAAKHDPAMDKADAIPPEVIEAERVIAEFFERRGSDRWELRRICSRNFAEDVRRITRILIQNP